MNGRESVVILSPAISIQMGRFAPIATLLETYAWGRPRDVVRADLPLPAISPAIQTTVWIVSNVDSILWVGQTTTGYLNRLPASLLNLFDELDALVEDADIDA